MIQFGDGTYKMRCPELWNGIVYVRDVRLLTSRRDSHQRLAEGIS